VKRILLADDSTLVRRTLRRLFEDSGWNVCGEASNGREAIAKAQELRPDIVVLDLSMPLLNGLTAAHILKETLPETYLILFTAFGALLTMNELKCAGFSASISKSDAGKLVNTAQTLLKAA
jgi:DNA-binding NarL/FixJ family response regulator